MVNYGKLLDVVCFRHFKEMIRLITIDKILLAFKIFNYTLHVVYRGGSRTAATSKMERFVIKRSILNEAAVLDPLLA